MDTNVVNDNQANVVIEQTFYETLPEGLYRAKINRIEPTDGLYGPQLCFHFDIFVTGAVMPYEQKAWCSQKFSAKSNLYKWTKAVIGDIPRDYNFNSTDLLGKDVQVLLEKKEPAEDGTVFNRVAKLLPAQQGTVAPSPATTTAGPELFPE